MKKKGILGVLLFVLCLVCSPIVAKAANIEYFGATSRAMTTNSIGKGEEGISIKGNSNNVANLYLGLQITNGESLQTVYSADITMANSKFKFTKCTANTAGGWKEVRCEVDANDPSLIHIEFQNETGISKTEALTDGYVAYLTFDTSEATGGDEKECIMKMKRTTPDTPDTPDTPKCKTDTDKEGNTKYYCENGAECTKEEYDAKCTTTTENPKTGSFMPYAVIIAGVAVAGGLYFLTKKNKIYHM